MLECKYMEIFYYFKKFLILILIILALIIGYATGRGYKTYEISLTEKSKNLGAKSFTGTSMQILLKKQASIFTGWKEPQVEAAFTPDSLGGGTLDIKLKSFWFTTTDFGKVVQPNKGHAYILVNNVLVGRAFNDLFSIPSQAFAPGKNIVQIVLAASDGSIWVGGSTNREISTTLEILK